VGHKARNTPIQRIGTSFGYLFWCAGRVVMATPKLWGPRACLSLQSSGCASLTAKMTAKPANDCGRKWTIADFRSSRLNWNGPRWTLADARLAVFKTVCGALLRRPGWVRFPSIPATSSGRDSQDDSHSSGRPRTIADRAGRQIRWRVRIGEHGIKRRLTVLVWTCQGMPGSVSRTWWSDAFMSRRVPARHGMP
jgi:hypothetical protein